MTNVQLPGERGSPSSTGGGDGRSGSQALRNFRLLGVGIALASCVVAIAGSLWLFPLLTDNSDEGAYLAQADALRSGQLIPRAPDEHSDAFRPWFTVHRDGHFIYKYAPVHPGLLAAARVVARSERAALGAFAALCIIGVIGLARELGATRRAALVAAITLALSPVFLVQSTTFLPYVGNLALLLGFSVLLLRGARRRSLAFVVSAGLAGSLALWARPFDALLFGGPVVVFVISRASRRDPREVARICAALLIGAASGIIAFLGYNAATTGDPLELPFRLLDSADTIGLGLRRTQPDVPYVDFTLARALEAARRNVLLLLSWSFGSVVLLMLGAYGLVRGPMLHGRWLLVTMMLLWPLGYLFFWGSYNYILMWDGGRFLGPYYYLPILVPLVIAAGVGFDQLLLRSKALSAIAVALMAGLTVPTFVHAISVNRPRTAARETVMNAVHRATAEQPSFIVIPAVWGPVLQNPFSFLRNAPDYEGHVVYALDIGPETLAVAQKYARRDKFVMSLPDGYDPRDSVGTRVWVDRAALVRGHEVELAVKAPNRLATDGLALRVGFGFAVIDVPFSASGRAQARVTVAQDGITVSGPAHMDDLTLELAPRRRHAGTEGQLDVSLVKVEPGGASTNLMARRVNVRTGTRRVEAVWPGAVSASLLDPRVRLRWTSRTIR